jgi:hypothetical protein
MTEYHERRTMKTATTYYRLGLAGAVATVLFLLFGMGALGIIGSGGRPDLMYLAVIAVGVVGAVIVRLRAGGMAWTLVAMAATLGVIAVVALAAGLQHRDGASVLEILMLNAMYAVLCLASAWLFRRADSSSSVEDRA